MRWTGHVARMGKREMHTGVWWRNVREGDHSEDPSLDGRIILILILKWILKGLDEAWTEWISFSIGRGGGLL